MNYFSLAAQDLAIDLGTSNTLVYKKNKGIILNEPSRVAIDINNGQIVAVGENAEEMIGKTPTNIVIFSALDEGVIADYEITRTMVKYFLEKSISGLYLLSPRVVVSVPSGITDVERRAVEDAVIQAGARNVLLIEEPLASAAGFFEDVFDPVGSMVINIGGGITEIAVTSLGRIVTSKSLAIGGESLNRDIISYIEESQNILLGARTAEKIKLAIGTCNSDRENEIYETSGRDILTGLPTSVRVSSKDITSLIQGKAIAIVDSVRDVLERTPPDLANNIMEKGVLVTGGSSKIDGINEFMTNYLNLPLIKDPEALTTTVVGVGKFIDKFNETKKSRIRKHT